MGSVSLSKLEFLEVEGAPITLVNQDAGTPTARITIQTPGAGTKGVTRKAMANANQTLTPSELERGVIVATGSLSQTRRLYIANPETDADAYVRIFRNDTDGTIRISLDADIYFDLDSGLSMQLSIEPDAIHNTITGI